MAWGWTAEDKHDVRGWNVMVRFSVLLVSVTRGLEKVVLVLVSVLSLSCFGLGYATVMSKNVLNALSMTKREGGINDINSKTNQARERGNDTLKFFLFGLSMSFALL